MAGSGLRARPSLSSDSCRLRTHSSSVHLPITPRRWRIASCAPATHRGSWRMTTPSDVRWNRPWRHSNGPGWSGLLPDDDQLHAARLTSETAAAVVERKTADGRQWVFLGPRLDAPPVDAFEGELVLDEPGVVGIAFGDRALALAHFLRATGGGGALLAQLGRRGPELRHMRRWLAPIVQELDAPRRLVAGWFAASSGGALFTGDEAGETTHRYIEVGIDS